MRSITLGIASLSLIVGSVHAQAFAADEVDGSDAQALTMRAKRLVASGASADGLALAERVINTSDGVPQWIRQVALDTAIKASSALKDVEGEARYALLLNALSVASQPEDTRRYARAPWLDPICDRYDRKNGAGSCALFSLKLTGVPALKDRGTGKRVRSLQDDDVSRAHKDYLKLIRDCVGTAAHEDPDRFDNETATVSWGIDQRGRAVEIEIAPRRMKNAAGACIEERLSWFRYPKSDSQEMKFVSVSFELTSVIRTELVATP